MTALKLIYSKLLAGEVFGKIDKHRQWGTYFWETLWINTGSNGSKYIFWRHYGESANKVSLQNLKWILNEIFRITPEEFLYEHTTYEEWKRINNSYERRA